MDISIVRSQPKPPNRRRLVVLGSCFVVYAIVIYLVQSGLGKMMVDRIKGPLETRLIEEAQIEHEAPPPPPPTFKGPPPVVIDMPAVNAIADAPVQATITETAKPKVEAPPPVIKADVIVPPRQDKRRPISSPDEIYPSMSKRLGEEGAVTLLLTLGEDGRVTDASIKESSGFERLDNAALADAKKGWRFLPGTVNGKPASMQLPFRVVFKMQK